MPPTWLTAVAWAYLSVCLACAAAGPLRPRRARPHGAAPPLVGHHAIAVSHCGSGCALGDIIGELAVFWLALTIAGTALGAEYAIDYVLALAYLVAVYGGYLVKNTELVVIATTVILCALVAVLASALGRLAR